MACLARSVLVLGMLLLALLWPATAVAGDPDPNVSLGRAGGLEYMKRVFPNLISQAGTIATCDGDAEVAGGGGSVSDPPASARLNETYPTASPEGWQVEGSTSPPSAQDVTSFAVCGPVVVGFQESPDAPDGGTVTHHAVPCPGGTNPISGGVRATGAGLSFPTTRPQLPPSTTSWFTTYENTSTEDTVTAAFAGCTSDYEVRYRTETVGGIRPGKAGRAVATCRRGEHVLGGGLNPNIRTAFGPLGVLDAWTVTTRPWDSGDRRNVPDDGWLARSYNDSAANFRLTAYAVCKQDP